MIINDIEIYCPKCKVMILHAELISPVNKIANTIKHQFICVGCGYYSLHTEILLESLDEETN